MAIKSEDLYLSIPNASPIFSKLAISSQFKVSLDLVRRSASGDNLGLYDYLTNCGIFNDTTSTSEKCDFLCSSASLPGSNFNISEELGSRQGMTERFATRRIYNEFDLTFYLDNDYNVLRMLEEWMNYINPIYNETNGRYDGSPSSQLGAYQERNTYSRFRYPDDYRRKLSITKFEKDFLKNPNDRNNTFNNMPLLTYNFIDAFPVNIDAVPLSYDGSTFLQVSVAFSYLRHTIEKHGNAQQSVNEKLANSSLTQINPLRPKIIGNEIRPSFNSPVPTIPVGYVSGKPYYGPFHEHMGVKMVGEVHSPYPHAVIYDTVQESLKESSTTGVITQTNPETETETAAGEGTTQTTQTTESSGGGTTTTETTTTTTTTDSSGSTSSTTSSSSSSSSSDSSSGSSGSSGSSYYGGGYYGGYSGGGFSGGGFSGGGFSGGGGGFGGGGASGGW